MWSPTVSIGFRSLGSSMVTALSMEQQSNYVRFSAFIRSLSGDLHSDVRYASLRSISMRALVSHEWAVFR